jgi:urease accessory protein
MFAMSRLISLFCLLFLFSAAAEAHVTGGLAGGFTSGLLHPVLGLDHVVAMVGVGLWGAFLGYPAIWILPVVFPMVMTLGGAMGIIGVPMFAVETGIALSAVVLGIMVAFAVRPPIWVAAIIVGFFAIFHGYAHGAELPESASPLAFSLGFVISTGLLHLAGIALGTLTHWKNGLRLVRSGGAVITAVGLGFLTGVL